MEELTALDASTLSEARDKIGLLLHFILEGDYKTASYFAGRLEQLLIDASTKIPADSSDTKPETITESLATSPLTGTVWDT